MTQVIQQRIMLEKERGCVIQNPGLTMLGGCERIHHHIKEQEDSVFLTPSSSPGAFSTEGNTYTNDMGYGFSHSPTGSLGGGSHMEASPLQTMPPQCPPPPPTSSFLAPSSPCEELCGSPCSLPYDPSSPHSLACSSPPHGSPASSIHCADSAQYPAYISPSNSIHDIPSSSLPPLTSGMSTVPYSLDNSGNPVYSNVQTSAGYYPNEIPPTSQWMSTSAQLPSFSVFSPSEQPPQMPHPQAHPGPIIDGELPVNVIDQFQMEADMQQHAHQLNFYPDTSSPTEGGHHHHHQVIYNIPDMLNLSSVGGNPIPPYPVPKTTKSVRKPKPPKPVVQVNDEHIKDIPTSAQLWEFTLRVLKKPSYHYMINWENRKEGLFRFHDAPAFAALWGKHRNRPNMTYDKVARALRYYYKRDILNQVGGRLTYRFSKRLSKLYTTDDSS